MKIPIVHINEWKEISAEDLSRAVRDSRNGNSNINYEHQQMIESVVNCFIIMAYLKELK